MAQTFPVSLSPQALAPQVQAGEYFCTDRDLYLVEEVHGEFALVEDCRTEIVLEIAIDEILEMRPVRRAGVVV